MSYTRSYLRITSSRDILLRGYHWRHVKVLVLIAAVALCLLGTYQAFGHKKRNTHNANTQEFSQP